MKKEACEISLKKTATIVTVVWFVILLVFMCSAIIKEGTKSEKAFGSDTGCSCNICIEKNTGDN